MESERCSAVLPENSFPVSLERLVTEEGTLQMMDGGGGGGGPGLSLRLAATLLRRTGSSENSPLEDWMAR